MRNAIILLLSAALSAAPAATAQASNIVDDDVLTFALDACDNQEQASWAPARRGEYLDSVVDYHHVMWDAQGVGGGLAAFELLDEDGNLIDLALPSGEQFQAFLIQTVVYGNGVRVHGCAVYLAPHAALSLDEMRQWSSEDPSEMLVGIAANESSWQLGPPEGSAWDHTIVSAFDPSIPQSSNATPHPFRGLIIRFIKMEF